MIEILINIDVDDLDKAIEFYTCAVGLRLERRLFEGTVAEMLGASSTIHLSVKAAGTRASPLHRFRRRYRRHWTPVHLDVVVEDVTAAVTRAEAAGATLEGNVETHAWGRIAYLSDPFGHGLCLVQLTGRGYDEMGSA